MPVRRVRAVYAYGDLPSNGCPTGYSKINDGATCQLALTALLRAMTAVTTNDANKPSGCYLDTYTNTLHVNTTPNPGAPNINARPLCVGALDPQHKMCIRIAAGLVLCACVCWRPVAIRCYTVRRVPL